ncbi:MAG: hypothetical protein HY887_08950 [Deltaproteobacteria bacterium]|nr:hypothetical protein [Deltaproteobacteria bacterium]
MRRTGRRRAKTYAFIGHDFTTRGGRKTKFRKSVASALKNSSFIPLYADTGREHSAVLKDITKKIEASEFCIFDLTGYKKKRKLGKNLNVILELGISIGLKKPAFVAYKERSIDFDKEFSDFLGEYRYPYKTHKELKQNIKDYITSLLKA